jgi:hypothetical protein
MREDAPCADVNAGCRRQPRDCQNEDEDHKHVGNTSSVLHVRIVMKIKIHSGKNHARTFC